MFSYFKDIQFAEKHWFWLLLIIPVMVIWYILNLKKQQGEFNFSSFNLLKQTSVTPKAKMRHSLFALRTIALTLIILAIARPQSKTSWKDNKKEGIDIILTMDVSLSMLAKDFKPNRFEVAKEVMLDFIDSRPNDKIGMVLFGGEAFTQCPLTTDHKVLKNMFPQIKAGSLDNGTAIGLGLATAVNRIKDSKSKSKVIVLISDGKNNAGEVSPLTAGELAKTYGLRVYCIGIGSKGKALQPVGMYAPGEYEYDYVDVDIDEDVMKEISNQTGGKYFRAMDKVGLQETYGEIDKMEKTIISEKSFTNKSEHFLPLAITAAILLLLEFILKYTLLRNIP